MLLHVFVSGKGKGEENGSGDTPVAVAVYQV
jgi:hypothetical protein